jgi:hypothetical protein
MIRSQKHHSNSRPLKSSKICNDRAIITVKSCIEALKLYLSKLDNPEILKVLMELERIYYTENLSKENIQFKPCVQYDTDDSRKVFNRLYDKYQQDASKLQQQIILKPFVSELEDKNNEIEKFKVEISNLKKTTQSDDYKELLKQCQLLETSMKSISKKCEKYSQSLQKQENLLNSLNKQIYSLKLENDSLKQQVLQSEVQNTSIIQSFEKNLLHKAQDYKIKTLSLLNCKSSPRLGLERASADRVNSQKNHRDTSPQVYLSPKVQKNYQVACITPPTFRNPKKFKKPMNLETLDQIRLKLP